MGPACSRAPARPTKPPICSPVQLIPFRATRRELRTVLVVAYATAFARQVRAPSPRAIRDAGPTSPNEMVENVGDTRSEFRHTSRLNLTPPIRKSNLSLYFSPTQ